MLVEEIGLDDGVLAIQQAGLIRATDAAVSVSPIGLELIKSGKRRFFACRLYLLYCPDNNVSETAFR
jgi:hypothetical protein